MGNGGYFGAIMESNTPIDTISLDSRIKVSVVSGNDIVRSGLRR
jgi:hypothetical protein